MNCERPARSVMIVVAAFAMAHCARTPQTLECPQPAAQTPEEKQRPSAAPCSAEETTKPEDPAPEVIESRAAPPDEPPVHRLPFPDGYETKIIQAFYGPLSHIGDVAFGVDFVCAEGDPLVATRDAVVWAVKEDSDVTCSVASKCKDDANYVVLDLGDGTYAQYHHLAPQGATVEVGEQVCAGQVVGKCGKTGFAFRPHLHFAITGPDERSIPFQLAEAREQQELGLPVHGLELVSRNTPTEGCKPVEPSPLPEDAFVYNGILLDAPLPRTLPRTPTTIQGRYFGDYPRVAVHRKPLLDGEWTHQCVEPADDGTFEVTVEWPDASPEPERHWLTLMGAKKNCEDPRWGWSYAVRVK